MLWGLERSGGIWRRGGFLGDLLKSLFSGMSVSSFIRRAQKIMSGSAEPLQKKCKTINSRYSLVVTHPTTNLPAHGLSTAERTGSPVFHVLWSIAKGSFKKAIICKQIGIERTWKNRGSLRCQCTPRLWRSLQTNAAFVEVYEITLNLLLQPLEIFQLSSLFHLRQLEGSA